jgi:hypothetical protein
MACFDIFTDQVYVLTPIKGIVGCQVLCTIWNNIPKHFHHVLYHALMKEFIILKNIVLQMCDQCRSRSAGTSDPDLYCLLFGTKKCIK